MNTFVPVTIVRCVSVAVLLVLPMTLDGGETNLDQQVDFNRDVRPLLSDKCFFCHGLDAKQREGGLRLDDRDSAFGRGESGETTIVAGHSDASELMRRLLATDPDEQMPPSDSGKSLSPQQIDMLRRWIDQGAHWQKHWAYQEPVNPTLPTVRNPTWCKNWVDRFILAKLEAKGPAPSSPADRVTLIRRLYFDLIGLPPTPEQVTDFVSDSCSQAYERVVDQLLASPHFGERMAMYWLDLVRYADTVGYHGDQDQSISPYRDYVIDAFNDNMPLDQFTHEQLAGDLIATREADQIDASRATDLKIASGYNRILQTSHEGGVQKKEYLAIYAADRIRNLSGVWMGSSLGCCQCHEHKFDPFTARDFYTMAAFFADIDEDRTFSGPSTIPTKREPEMLVFSPSDQKELVDLQTKIAILRQQDPESQMLAGLEQQKSRIEQRARRTMITVAVEPRTIRILPRGNWLDETGEIVEPAIPEFFGKLETGSRRADRLDLARWLTDTKTGTGLLTARVFANRFWYQLFGTGIAKQLDDFGIQGSLPSHAQLLDALAIHLVKSNWNTKQMMKLLVMSQTYQQSSLTSAERYAADPENRLFARQSRYRLPAELIRDNALSISGLLVEDVGGTSARPYQPAGYYRHLNFPERTYTADTDDRQWRRGVYVHWQRQFLHPMLQAFDAPSREECTADRSRSNTPLAALVLLNDPTFLEAARVLAERMIQEGGDTIESQINFAFQRAVSRVADAEELSLLKNLLLQSKDLYRVDPSAAEALIQIGQQPAKENIEPIELAAWSIVARAILNMHETITRN